MVKELLNKLKLITFILFFPLGLYAQHAGYTLAWSDEFGGAYVNPDAVTGLDLDTWSFELGNGDDGWGTSQRDYATRDKANVEVSDGTLKIRTQRNYQGQGREYTSGRLNSKNKQSFLYGKIEARIRTNNMTESGRGFAFWMMPNGLPAGDGDLMWPQGGEIDIFEYNGLYPRYNLGSTHYAWNWNDNGWGGDGNHAHAGGVYDPLGRNNNVQVSGRDDCPNSSSMSREKTNLLGSEWHVYGINWFSDRIEFFVDQDVYHVFYLNRDIWCGENETNDLGNKKLSTGWTFDKNGFPDYWRTFENPFYIILSAGVGGNRTYGGDIVNGNNPNQWTCTTEIDWVRVYEKDDVNPPVIKMSQSQYTAQPGQVAITPIKESGNDISKIEVFVDSWRNGGTVVNGATYNWGATEGCHKVWVRACDAAGYWGNWVVSEYIIGSGCDIGPYNETRSEIPSRIPFVNFDEGPEGWTWNTTNTGAGPFREGTRVDVRDNGTKIEYVGSGEFLRYSVDIKEDGKYRVGLRAAANAQGTMSFRFEKNDITSDELSFTSNPVGWQNYQEHEFDYDFYLKAGEDILYADMNQANYNLDWFEFERVGDYVEVPQQPSAIVASNNNPEAGETITYSVDNVPGVTYNWTVLGGNILSGQGSNVVEIQWNSIGEQTIKVTPENSGRAGTPRIQQFTVSPSSSCNLTVSILGVETITCTEPVVTLTASSSQGGVSYSWSGGGSSSTKQVTTSGTYSVTVTTNLCLATASVSINEDKQVPTVAISPSTPQVDAGKSIALEANATGTVSAYEWRKGTVKLQETGSVLQLNDIKQSDAGVYTVIAKNGSCESEDKVTLQVILSTEIEQDNVSKIMIYPNPVRDFITIVTPENEKVESVDLFTLGGMQVLNFTGNQGGTFSLEGLNKGSYLLRVKTEKNNYVEKIILY